MVECGAATDVGHASITPYTVLIRACGKVRGRWTHARQHPPTLLFLSATPVLLSVRPDPSFCATPASAPATFHTLTPPRNPALTARSRAPLLLSSQKVLAVDKAFKVLRCMLDAGVKPNVVTFNCLIDACGRTQQLDTAFHVLQLMHHYDSPPDAVTFSCAASRTLCFGTSRITPATPGQTNRMTNRPAPHASHTPALRFAQGADRRVLQGVRDGEGLPAARADAAAARAGAQLVDVRGAPRELRARRQGRAGLRGPRADGAARRAPPAPPARPDPASLLSSLTGLICVPSQHLP